MEKNLKEALQFLCQQLKYVCEGEFAKNFELLSSHTFETLN